MPDITNSTLHTLRGQIDAIDTHIVHLLNQRAALARQAGAAKAGKSIRRPAREDQVIRNMQTASDGSLPDASIEAIGRSIINACRHIQYRGGGAV